MPLPALRTRSRGRTGRLSCPGGRWLQEAVRSLAQAHEAGEGEAAASRSVAGRGPGPAQHYYGRRRAAGDAHATALRKVGRDGVMYPL